MSSASPSPVFLPSSTTTFSSIHSTTTTTPANPPENFADLAYGLTLLLSAMLTATLFLLGTIFHFEPDSPTLRPRNTNRLAAPLYFKGGAASALLLLCTWFLDVPVVIPCLVSAASLVYSFRETVKIERRWMSGMCCRRCGKRGWENVVFCTECGCKGPFREELGAEGRCAGCGWRELVETKFCSHCGERSGRGVEGAVDKVKEEGKGDGGQGGA